MELTPEYIKAVRFTVKRGNTYDAAEVDAFFKPYRAYRNERNRRMVAAVPIPLQRCIPYAPR